MAGYLVSRCGELGAWMFCTSYTHNNWLVQIVIHHKCHDNLTSYYYKCWWKMSIASLLVATLYLSSEVISSYLYNFNFLTLYNVLVCDVWTDLCVNTWSIDQWFRVQAPIKTWSFCLFVCLSESSGWACKFKVNSCRQA